MKTIFKYPMGFKGSQELLLPADGKILSIQIQDAQGSFMGTGAREEALCAWVLFKETGIHTLRTIVMFGTGEKIAEEEQDRLEYISTVQNGRWVWHFFELK